MSKNWNIVFVSFDPADPGAGPTGFHTVVTDGLKQSCVLQRGRLWKKDRRSAAILLFPETQIAVRLNTKSVSIRRRSSIRRASDL
ncbi:hypothetical protein [Sphingomonas sp. 10B4]|uniref:hypothetical protein n=1 Tax=Sphingomonas sp. 10B4 TaxID=3048575 RepID=UPI002AB3499F|nr:hypothetical protein [Sphingomonas sp. 10B4]MDY7524580.1 hypothetical protein [Sphingomonas sp. 10B4]MEB0284007.1 hypothetical protein [Sphingomonas sp. 10B4]